MEALYQLSYRGNHERATRAGLKAYGSTPTMHNLFRGTFISVKVRLANLSDAEEIANIYNHEVLSGVATFDLVPRALDEQREWLRERQELYHA